MAIFLLEPLLSLGHAPLIADRQPVIVFQLRDEPDFLFGYPLDATGSGVQEQWFLVLKEQVVELTFINTYERGD